MRGLPRWDAYGHEEATILDRGADRRQWLREKCASGEVFDRDAGGPYVRRESDEDGGES